MDPPVLSSSSYVVEDNAEDTSREDPQVSQRFNLAFKFNLFYLFLCPRMQHLDQSWLRLRTKTSKTLTKSIMYLFSMPLYFKDDFFLKGAYEIEIFQ